MKLKITALLILVCSCTFATHLIGGYIAMKHVSGYTYEVKYVSITNVSAQIQADRCWQTIYFSDGDSIIINRLNGPIGSCQNATMGVVIANGIKYNSYQGLKTFNNPGNYTAWVMDANRSDGIINIPGSINVPMYHQSYITVVDPALYCPISTVDLGSFPVLKSNINENYFSDLSIIRTDGDSVTYRIDTCRVFSGNAIVGYSLPQGLSVNGSNGKLAMNTQAAIGSYALALRINTWRNGILVSYVTLDYSTQIYATGSNNVNLPITSNLTLNNDSIYSQNYSVTDTIKINYDNTAQYQVNLYSEINSSLITQNTIGAYTNLSIANLAQLERKQPYKLTLRAVENPMTTNASKDYIFYFTVGNTDSLLCTLPLDLGKNEISKNEIQPYPNPAQNELFFTNVPHNATIQCYNLQGQLVYAKPIQKNVIDISKLPAGLYFYKICDASGAVVSNGKMVKE